MTLLNLPWTEMCVAFPFLGAGAAIIYRDPFRTSRWAVSFSAAILVLSFMPWIALSSGQAIQGPFFAVDGLTGLLLPLVSLLHFLTVLATARVKLNRMSLVGHMIGEGVRLGTFAVAPDKPWLLILFLILGVVPPFVELVQRRKPTRIYTLHMSLFVVLLAVGWISIERGLTTFGSTLLMLAVLVRSGTVPAHLWVSDLFENATFGTALLFATPLVGVFTTLRLILPIAPEWVLSGISYVSLITALYSAGMATVQTEARRFFAYLFLSHASLVLVGLELHTTASLTGSLCLWISISVSLGGFGITMRAIEARYGRLTLTRYLGLYEQSRMLAVCFLLTGLGSVGFPGTISFIAAELLLDGVIQVNLFIGVVMVATAALNGIAVVRAYLSLFNGTTHSSSIPLKMTMRERVAVLTLVGMVLGFGLMPQIMVKDRSAIARETIQLLPTGRSE